MIAKYKYYVIIAIIFIVLGFVISKKLNPFNTLFNASSDKILYEPGKDPKIHEMYVIDSMNNIHNHYKDSVSNATIKTLQSEITAYEQDSQASEKQVNYLGHKKSERDKTIDNLKPGTDTENAINIEWNKRHKK